MAVILRTSLQGCGLEGIIGRGLGSFIGCSLEEVLRALSR